MKDANKVRVGLTQAENNIGFALDSDCINSDEVKSDDEVRELIACVRRWLNYAEDGLDDVASHC